VRLVGVSVGGLNKYGNPIVLCTRICYINIYSGDYDPDTSPDPKGCRVFYWAAIMFNDDWKPSKHPARDLITAILVVVVFGLVMGLIGAMLGAVH